MDTVNSGHRSCDGRFEEQSHNVAVRLCCIDTQSRGRMNALRTLLVLAHLLVSLYTAIRYACDATYRWCTKEFWHTDSTAELDALVRTLTKFKKIPRHLVIVLGLCDESVLDCVRIIGWCITLDIPYISFFDRNGKNTIWYITLSVCAKQIRARRNSTKHSEKEIVYICVYVTLTSIICRANLSSYATVLIAKCYCRRFFLLDIRSCETPSCCKLNRLVSYTLL